MMEKYTTPVSWQNGVPVSSQFDDPYYSLDDGLSESRHNFYNGAAIKEHLAKKKHVTIAETGFGTGLNFLATWQNWKKSKSQSRLTFMSAEAFPLNIDQLTQAHTAFPEVSPYARELREKWPPPAPGFHLIPFEGGAIRLIIMIGDAAQMFAQARAKIDAWYLDGFAPAKNPGMWTDALFSTMAGLSAQGATVATFTAAGFVRRGLIAAGFDMQKTPGFGRKRERLVGIFEGHDQQDNGAPGYSKGNKETRNADKQKQSNVKKLGPAVPRWAAIEAATHQRTAVVGAGIGGLMTAHALASRGIKASVYSAPEASNTSQHLPVAVMAPKLGLTSNPVQRFQTAAFVHAVQHPVYQEDGHSDTGTIMTARHPNDIIRLKKIAALYQWPDDWMTVVENGSLVLPKAKTITPHIVLKSLSQSLSVKPVYVHHVKRYNGLWQLVTAGGDIIDEADTLIIAAGMETTGLLERSGLSGKMKVLHPELRPNAGQMEIVDAERIKDAPDAALSYGGYLSAGFYTEQGVHMRGVGSTFDKLDTIPANTELTKPTHTLDEGTDKTATNRRKNLENLQKNTGITINAAVTTEKDASITSWAGLRATTADHMPFAGPVPDWHDLQNICAPLAVDAKQALPRDVSTQDGLYLLTGLGSKGFQYAPLLADYLAAMIAGEPLPVPAEMIARLHPARSFVRAIIKSDHHKA